MTDVFEPRVVSKPWGYERIVAQTDRYAGKILHIDPGQALSLQYHNVKDETLHVLSGTLLLEVGSVERRDRLTVEAGRSFRLVPGTVHRFTAPDDSGVDLFEISSPELDDVVRLEDRYGREGTSEP